MAFRHVLLLTSALFMLIPVRAESMPDKDPQGIGADAEETFELRMERILQKSGRKGLVDVLRKETSTNYRPYAAAWLANYLLYGDIFGLAEVHDENAGMAMAKKAMEEGSIFAKEMVGRAMVDGRGVSQRRPNEGAKLLQEAAETGRFTAMAELAKLYFYGYGVPRDLGQAETWARRAAYRGAPYMLHSFGVWTEEGKAGWKADMTRACRYYLEAAEWGNGAARQRLQALEKAGTPEARISLQMLLLFDLAAGGDFTTPRIKRAVQILEAECPEDPQVLVAVGQIRMERMQPVYDHTKAWAQFEKAAQKGETDGLYHQAEMIRRGIGRKKDVPTALAKIHELAERSNAHAMGRLGWLYYWGAEENRQQTKDEAKAFTYAKKAAHAGDMTSVLNTGFMYEHGIGTPVNYYMSARYYSIAEDVGYRDATRRKNAALAFIKD